MTKCALSVIMVPPGLLVLDPGMEENWDLPPVRPSAKPGSCHNLKANGHIATCPGRGKDCSGKLFCSSGLKFGFFADLKLLFRKVLDSAITYNYLTLKQDLKWVLKIIHLVLLCTLSLNVCFYGNLFCHKYKMVQFEMKRL